MPVGRKKKPRNICIDFDAMICDCFGPLKLKKKELKQRPKEYLEADEMQTLIYQDIEWLTMDIASKKLWVSKTVYAWIYASARTKVTKTIIENNVLFLPKAQESEEKASTKLKKEKKKTQKKKK